MKWQPGSLIKHQLLSNLTLSIAVHTVLEALRKPPDTKVFAYGILALEQFLDCLVDLPLLCNHILQISHLHGTHVELIAFIEHTLARISSSHLISNGGSSSFTDPHSGSIPTTVEMVELVGPRSSQHGKQLSSSLPVQQIHQGMQHSSTTGFGSALNIETLVAAAERRDTSIELKEGLKDLSAKRMELQNSLTSLWPKQFIQVSMATNNNPSALEKEQITKPLFFFLEIAKCKNNNILLLLSLTNIAGLRWDGSGKRREKVELPENACGFRTNCFCSPTPLYSVYAARVSSNHFVCSEYVVMKFKRMVLDEIVM
ncbi:CCR4-NOT transcription complex subunit 1 [Camellia lanceoleosa]|uniref:CCR4-NOT transcription complex subunit 1 n=1 Tax=Camellia lanceoleosa TaxID=1840588 RepID=A0ACC0IMJ4_9ERIC|nr:CCR4-NOT transcription complex subunit 1 [Camellia lanceoleosa]